MTWKIICSPITTMVLFISIGAVMTDAFGSEGVEEIKAPIEVPTCEYNKRYKCP